MTISPDIEVVGEYWHNLHTKWINNWFDYGFASQDEAIECVGKSIASAKETNRKMDELHLKVLNGVVNGKINFNFHNMDDDKVDLWIKISIRLNIPEATLYFQKEKDRRNGTVL